MLNLDCEHIRDEFEWKLAKVFKGDDPVDDGITVPMIKEFIKEARTTKKWGYNQYSVTTKIRDRVGRIPSTISQAQLRIAYINRVWWYYRVYRDIPMFSIGAKMSNRDFYDVIMDFGD